MKIIRLKYTQRWQTFVAFLQRGVFQFLGLYLQAIHASAY